MWAGIYDTTDKCNQNIAQMLCGPESDMTDTCNQKYCPHVMWAGIYDMTDNKFKQKYCQNIMWTGI